MNDQTPPGATRYRRAANLRELPDGALLSPRSSGQRFFPTAQQRQLLRACSLFRTADELTTLTGATDSDLESMVSAGLLESEQGIIRGCMSDAPAADLPPVADVGIVTCAAPELLRRSVTSWAEVAARHAREVRFIVADDSPNRVAAAGQRAAARALESRPGQHIYFVDPVIRAELARDVAKVAGVEPDTIAFGLNGRTPPRVGIGANRNLLTLLTRGRRFISADDDVVADFAESPNRRGLTWITSSEVPLEAWFFDSPADTAARIDVSHSLDPFREHESIVGRSLGSILAARNGAASLQGADAALTAAVDSGMARVAATTFGLFGDCASDCAAFFSLLATGDTRRRLFARTEPMSSSREVLRRVPAAVFCQGVGLMTFCHAIDNAHFVPPYFPVGRGEDQLWQKLLHFCDPSALVGHLPVAVSHRPKIQRLYSGDDYLDPCREFPANAFLLGVIDSCPVPYAGFDARERLVWLADYLGGIAREPQAFNSLVEQAWRASVSHHLRLVQTALEQRPRDPAWWRDALHAALQRLQRSLTERRSAALEYAGLPAHEAADALRLDVVRFAGLLKVWPDVLATAADLSARMLTDADWLRP